MTISNFYNPTTINVTAFQCLFWKNSLSVSLLFWIITMYKAVRPETHNYGLMKLPFLRLHNCYYKLYYQHILIPSQKLHKCLLIDTGVRVKKKKWNGMRWWKHIKATNRSIQTRPAGMDGCWFFTSEWVPHSQNPRDP